MKGGQSYPNSDNNDAIHDDQFKDLDQLVNCDNGTPNYTRLERKKCQVGRM